MSVEKDYELQGSYVIRRNVLSPDLRGAVLHPGDYFRIPQLPYVPLSQVTDLGSWRLIGSIIEATNIPTLTTMTIDPAAVEVLASTLTSDGKGATIAALLERLRSVCLGLFDRAVRSALGTKAVGPLKSVVAHIVQQMTVIHAKAEAAMPFRISSTDSSPVALAMHISNIDNIFAQNWTTLPPFLMEEIFTEDMRQLYLMCMRPYFRAKYVAGLTQGPWNLAGNLGNISFYDSRYSELALYRMAMAYYDMLKNLTTDTSQQTYAISMYDDYRNALDVKLNISDEAIMQGHEQIAQLSAGTKMMAAFLYDKNSDFKFRKQTLSSLASAVHHDRVAYDKSKQRFYAWCAAYAAVVIVALALLATQRYSSFLLMSAFLLVIVAIYLLTHVVLKFTNNVLS